jgi:hypothetical protein
VFKQTVSFGSVSSLVALPSEMSHASIPESERAEYLPPDLVRISAGIEDPADLVRGLSDALAVAQVIGTTTPPPPSCVRRLRFAAHTQPSLPFLSARAGSSTIVTRVSSITANRGPGVSQVAERWQWGARVAVWRVVASARHACSRSIHAIVGGGDQI